MPPKKKGDIKALCTWTKADFADFKLGPLFEKIGIGKRAEGLFGEVPKVFVHRGDVALAGPLLCDANGHGVYILDGDLTVAGAFTFFASDAYTVLVVTGDLRAAHLQQARDTQLVILGATTIDGLLHIAPSDAGFAVFRGAVTSKHRVVIDNGVGSDVPMFAKKPKGTEQALADDLEPEQLHAALVANKPVFAPAAPVATATPLTPKEMEKLTVAEFFAGLGTTVQCTGIHILASKINAGYISTGKPGALTSMVLRDDTEIDAFPPTLAKLASLEIWDYQQPAVLDRVLRLLPQLPALTKLTVQGTAVTALPPELGNLKQLAELHLYNNAQLASLPAELGKLKKLKKLWLRGHAIASVPAEVRALKNQLTFDRVDGVPGWD